MSVELEGTKKAQESGGGGIPFATKSLFPSLKANLSCAGELVSFRVVGVNGKMISQVFLGLPKKNQKGSYGFPEATLDERICASNVASLSMATSWYYGGDR